MKTSKNKHNTNSIILLSFAGLLFLLPALLLACGLILPPQYNETFLGEMKYKIKRLQEQAGQRLVFVGGSNVPFALKSELIQACFPQYGVVDFGMYADMGMVVMLDWAKTEIHEGDIFILMPEQSSQTLSCYFSGEDIWQAADGAFELILPISSRRYEKLASTFPVFAGKKLFYAVNGSPSPDGIYSRASFNSHGDISYPDREYNIMAGGYDPNHIISFSPEMLGADFIMELNDFAREANAKGASVYYHFPPMNERALETDTTKARIDSYYDLLQEQLSFPILGSPYRSLMESGWFYDTNYHLNDSGATLFTKYMAEDLKVLFRDTSITDIPSPPMPEIPYLLAEGDNSCLDCFLYRKEEDGWYIDALTSKGLSSPVLTLPFSYEGEPIVGMSDKLFAGNTALRELTIQSNLGILYDAMFQGCTNFQKLILPCESPSAYTVGDSLMEGAEFLIYVPAQAIDSYRRHYSWQKYSSYLMPWEENAF